MAPSDAARKRVEKDARALEQKYSSDAVIYAQARSEAAEIRGDEDGKEHWDDIADDLEGDAADAKC